MAHYIDKDAVIAEIEKKLQDIIAYKENTSFIEHRVVLSTKIDMCKEILSLLDNIEVKEVEDNSLEKFKSLKHINKDLDKTLEYLGYAPNLYHFDGRWHVDWISCEDGDSIKCFTEDTPEEAIDKACNWFHSTFCSGLVKDDNNHKITIGTKIRSKTNPDVILSIISDDCHEDKFECSNGSVLSLKQIEEYYDIII